MVWQDFFLYLLNLNPIEMKKYIFFMLLLAVSGLAGCQKDGSVTPGLTDEEVIKGLKDALTEGTDTSVNLTHRLDGYFRNAAIKILLPPEAQVVEDRLRSIGLGSLCDDAILSLNRAA